MTQSQQKLTLTLVLATLLASNVVALAQQKSGAKPTPADKQAAAEGLDLSAPANGSTTSGSIAAPPASIDVSDEFADDAGAGGLKPIPDLDGGSKQVGEQFAASDATRLRELEGKVDRLEKLIEGQSATLQAIHDELVKLNSKQNLARPDLGGEQPSLASIGKLVVNNYTGNAFTMSINGNQLIIGPGRSEMNVPYGPVTTQILGYEVPKSWAETDWRDVDGQPQLALQIR